MVIKQERDSLQDVKSVKSDVKKNYNQKICWGMLLLMILGHLLLIIGLYYLLTGRVKVFTYLWSNKMK